MVFPYATGRLLTLSLPWVPIGRVARDAISVSRKGGSLHLGGTVPV